MSYLNGFSDPFPENRRTPGHFTDWAGIRDTALGKGPGRSDLKGLGRN